MRWRGPTIVAASAVLVSCALISGAADLTTADPPPDGGVPAEIDAGGSLPDVIDAIDATTPSPDASGDAEAGPSRVLCDEPGLVARWTFDEGSGAEVHDCTHFRHDGRVDGGHWVQGERDGGMAFDGGWVGFGNPAAIQLTTALTACAWIRPAAAPGVDPDRRYIVGKLSDPFGGGWRIAVGRGTSATDVLASINVPDGDGGYNDTKGGSFALAVWTHVCGVYTPSRQSIFVNGVRVGNDAKPSVKITVTTDELRIGARADGTYPYIGAVDDVRIYSRALADLEIEALAEP